MASEKLRPRRLACSYAQIYDSLPALLFTIIRTLISSFEAQRALIVEDRGRVVDALSMSDAR